MARGRFLSKSICSDKEVSEILNNHGAETALFYTWMIPHLDKNGLITGEPSLLKGMVFPRFEKVTAAKIDKMVNELTEARLIIQYRAPNGDRTIMMPGFEKNQTGLRKNREPESGLIMPSEADIEGSGFTPDLIRKYAGSYPEDFRKIAGNDPEDCRPNVKYKYKYKSNVNDKLMENPEMIRQKDDVLWQIKKVVDYYQLKNPGKGKVIKPGHKDFKLIKARLNEGFTVEDLKMAVDGNHIDEWHVTNAKHQAEYVFRNSTKVEGFIDDFKRGRTAGIKPTGWVKASIDFANEPDDGLDCFGDPIKPVKMLKGKFG